MSLNAVFRDGLTDPTARPPEGLLSGAGGPAGKRYDVYRNNVMQSLTEVLRAGFQVVRTLLGPVNFDGLAAMYIRAHPPQSPVMQLYGAAFPEFLAQMPALSHLGYLPDAARLDYALRQSYHAEDAEPFDPTALATLSPDALAKAHLGIAPAVILLASDWPLYDIWRFNTQTDAPKPSAEAQWVLITRAEFDPQPHHLTPAQGAWVQAVMAGAPLAEAHDAAKEFDDHVDIAHPLGILMAQKALTSLF